ncbi:MAG TPA: hypothetical protein ENH45_00785 [Nitrospirae bacterium]|nr:hypothetical protein BMS3Bbin08_00469 [bacterium BMS3Bbin08]HDH51600.1 hypothetical protein [Nitrospirota bacterium]HDZ83728.1 hypothetical protein [Nitrospirota bacterium]
MNKKADLEKKQSEYFDKELGALMSLQRDVKRIWLSGELDFKEEKQITRSLLETIEARNIQVHTLNFNDYIADSDLVTVFEEITMMLFSDPIFLRLWLHNAIPEEETSLKKNLADHIETKHESYIYRIITGHAVRPGYKELPSTRILKDTFENYLLSKGTDKMH